MEEDGVGLEITTELRLGLPSHSSVGCEAEKLERKRVLDEVSSESANKVQRKGEVVGWPPVCSYRKKKSAGGTILETSKNFVKVSMDGAPFLRKIDLGTHEGYSGLAFALDKLFGCCGIGEALRDGESGEYVQIYEDKDGDWMLVGDVPWQMFRESCKRLRIMKRSEAKFFGVQPAGGAEIIK